MKLLPLTNDFTFKAVFSNDEDVLIDLLNSFPEFQGKNKIASLKVLNPEIPKDMNSDKGIVLDIKAVDSKGNKFLIEMQASSQLYFPQRALYYWSKLYSKSIGKGQDFEKLPRVYSINFVNFPLFKNEPRFYWSFQVSSKEQPEILLTEDLSIHIIEIPKFHLELDSIQNPLDYWVYLLKEAVNIKGEQMKTLQKKNPKIKKAINKLKFVSHDKESRELYEARLKTELDYKARFAFQLQKMREEGIQEGIERGIEKGKVETAKQLLAWGMKREQICKITGLKDSDF